MFICPLPFSPINKAQAEGLMSEIRAKEREVERLNGLRSRVDDETMDASSSARNRFGKSIESSSDISDYSSETSFRRHGGRKESQQRLMFLRSAFVLYILALNVIVFIKISF